jgi:hypothetical protein
MCATFAGYVDCVRLLLERGADISIKNKYGNTVFDIAQEYGHWEVLRIVEDMCGPFSSRGSRNYRVFIENLPADISPYPHRNNLFCPLDRTNHYMNDLHQCVHNSGQVDNGIIRGEMWLK